MKKPKAKSKSTGRPRVLPMTELEHVEMWKGRIRWAEAQLKPHVREWQRNVRMLQGRVGSFGEDLEAFFNERSQDLSDFESYVYVNVFYSIHRSMFSSMNVNNPIWIGKAARPDDERIAPLWGEIVNQRHREMDIERLVERAVADAIYCSRSIIKQSWMLRFERPSPMVGGEPDVAVTHPTDVRAQERFEAYAERPLGVRIAPQNFLFDFTVGEPSDSPWFIERIWKRPEDLANDPSYAHTEDLVPDGEVKPGMIDAEVEPTEADPDLSRTLGSEQYDAQRIALYEIHDLRNGKLYAVTMGSDKFHRDDRYPYDHRVLREGTGPYTVLSLTVTVPDEPNPIPMASAIRDLVLEKSDIRTLRLEYQRRSLPVLGVHKDGMEEEDLERLTDGEMCKIVRTKVEPRSVIQAIGWPSLNQDVSVNEGLIDRDVQEITGSTPQARGFSTGATATENSIIDARLQGVEADARRRVRRMMIEIGRKTLALEHEFMPDDTPRWAMVTGRLGLRKLVQPGQPPFAKYRKSDIPEQFEIDIDVKSFTPTPPELKRKQMMDLTNMLGQYTDFNPMWQQLGQSPPVDGTELLRLLIESFDIPNAEAVLPALITKRPAQDPSEEWAAWLTGVEPKVSDNDNHAEHIVTHQMELQNQLATGWQPTEAWKKSYEQHLQKHQLRLAAAALQQQVLAGGGGPGASNPGPAGGKLDPSSYNRSAPDVPSLLRSANPQRGSGI